MATTDAARAMGAEVVEQPLAGCRWHSGPMPLQEAPRLSATLRGPRILVKRDEGIALMFGGNKVRQTEFVLGDALDQAADVFTLPSLIGFGAVDDGFVFRSLSEAGSTSAVCLALRAKRPGCATEVRDAHEL